MSTNDLPADAQYPRLITEIAERLSVPAWDAHEPTLIDVAGTSVGCLYSAEQSPETLHLCILLGPPGPLDSERDLLQRNATEFATDNGAFGLHPESGDIVYRVSIALRPNLSGLDVVNYIEYVLIGLQQRQRDRK